MALSLNSVTVSGVAMSKAPPLIGPMRFFRLNILAHNANGVIVQAFRLNVGMTAYPTVSMTSDTAPSPLVASASSVQNGSTLAYNAFNAAPGSGSPIWYSVTPTFGPGEWLQIDLGAGNEILPTGCLICPDGNVSFGFYITEFSITGSNTGAFSGEEVTLYTDTNPGAWTNNTPKTFTF